MKGKRLADDIDWSSQNPNGSYWRHQGVWVCITPNGHFGSLRKHQVIEHEDGSITVTPAILVSTVRPKDGQSVELWHGFLERGSWREC